MKLRAPQFLTDVFRDLRDRRLLIPAIALLAALVAVPMLLSRSQDGAPPPPAPAGEVALEGVATQPAVLAESVTVRDYKQRLDELKSKNPFSEHFSAPEIGKGAGLEGLGGAPVTDVPAGATTDTGTIGASSSRTTTSSSTSTSTDTSSGSNHSPPKPDPITRFLTHRIDVLVGPVGSVEQRNGVEQLKLLPSNSAPVLAFLGVSEDGRRAVFLVSDDVSGTSGDGACFPSPASCRYVVMREGDERTFDYTPDGLTYKLKLRQIRDVKLKDAPGVSVP